MTADVAAETLAWVTRAVVGLNLCPFAKAPLVKGQIRCVVSEAGDGRALLAVLRGELELLAQARPEKIETTLVVHPRVFVDFAEFNDFLDEADQLLDAMDLTGVIQLASFHPQYRFAGTEENDMGNATNRSPYPTLHLLREESVERAVDAFPEAEAIFEANVRALEALGPEGWAELQAQCRRDAQPPGNTP
ncbi:MAG: DUF1415 domain-containing protein [Burkholderiales bacterium]